MRSVCVCVCVCVVLSEKEKEKKNKNESDSHVVEKRESLCGGGWDRWGTCGLKESILSQSLSKVSITSEDRFAMIVSYDKNHLPKT